MKWNRQEILRTMATFGIALLLAGYLRYTLQGGEIQRFSEILLIGGGVLFLAALGFGYREVMQYFGRRSSKLGANALTLVVSVLAILVLLNFLGYRHHKRFDLTTEKLFTLSDQTRTIVSGLKQDVDIMRFAQHPDPELKDRMTEYTNLSSRLHYKEVDPQRNPEIAHQFGVTRMEQVVVSSGSNHQILEATGEQDLTNGIVKVTRNTVKTVCFVEGHGEKAITSSEPDGFSGASDALKKDSYQTQSVNLVTAGAVPPECSVVVIPGPKQAFLPVEAQILTKYLDGGGKAFLMVDPEKDPKLDDLLATWNIKVGDNWVIDASALSQMAQTGPIVPLVVDYGTSPITRNFSQSMTFYPEARTVSIADKNKTQPEDTELMKTSARSFTIPKLDLKKPEIKYDAKTDTLGPLSLGVAAQRKSSGDSAAKGGRFVVIGNSQFAANNAFGQVRNGDLFSNTVNWLAEDEDLISIRPKSATNRRVNLTETQERELNWFSLLLLPGIVILSGTYIWWKRR
jgi:gliding motility-associatede transport system auxiliary component